MRLLGTIAAVSLTLLTVPPLCARAETALDLARRWTEEIEPKLPENFKTMKAQLPGRTDADRYTVLAMLCLYEAFPHGACWAFANAALL